MNDLVIEVVNGETYQFFPLGKHVVRAVGVCGGRPTFKYTRIEITGTLDRLAAGEPLDEVVAGYRGRVSREAVVEAIQVVMAGFLQTLPVSPVSDEGASTRNGAPSHKHYSQLLLTS